MQLHQLKYFVSVVDTGSVTKAAEHCFISQPSISQQLTKLEYDVGKKLFSRVKGKLILTEPGKIMYEQACKILRSVEDARHRVNDVDNTSGGSVTIGILPTLAPFMLPKLLLALAEKFPEALVTVREDISEALIAAAQQGEIDILIEVLPFDDTNLDVVPLFFDQFCIAVHQDNPLAKLEKIPIVALNDMPFILLEDIHCLTRQIQQYCFNEGFMPKVLFQASQLATIYQLIKIKYGISIMPSLSVDADSESCIRYIKFKGVTPGREVVLATTKDRYFSPAAEYFINTVKELYQTT